MSWGRFRCHIYQKFLIVDIFLLAKYNISKIVGTSYWRLEMKKMLAELRAKSQITIPKELVDKLGLSAGDKLDLYEKDGIICIMPVVVYPKKYLDELREEIEETKARIASGEQPVYDNVNALFAMLKGN